MPLAIVQPDSMASLLRLPGSPSYSAPALVEGVGRGPPSLPHAALCLGRLPQPVSPPPKRCVQRLSRRVSAAVELPLLLPAPQAPFLTAIPAPDARVSRRLSILSGLDSACDSRLWQPVKLIRRPQIRDVKACTPSWYPMRCLPCRRGLTHDLLAHTPYGAPGGTRSLP